MLEVVSQFCHFHVAVLHGCSSWMCRRMVFPFLILPTEFSLFDNEHSTRPVWDQAGWRLRWNVNNHNSFSIWYFPPALRGGGVFWVQLGWTVATTGQCEDGVKGNDLMMETNIKTSTETPQTTPAGQPTSLLSIWSVCWSYFQQAKYTFSLQSCLCRALQLVRTYNQPALCLQKNRSRVFSQQPVVGCML